MIRIKVLVTLLLLGIIVLANNVRGDQKSRRATIDSLRWGFDYKSAEAYRNANRAQYLDSTYYVGYLIEGYHFFEKAEDQRGIAKAVPPLNKALDLFENDFGYCLNKRYSKGDIYTGAYRDLLRQIDYLTISSTLVDCYFSLEQPDKVYQALSRLKDTDLAYDYRSFQGLAWLYFRSRIYDNEKYAFLKNTIERNLQTSLAYTDSLQLKYQKNTPYVRSQILEAYAPGTGVHQFFQESFVEQPSGYIANTRGILYGYNLRPQIAVNYFEKMSGEDNLAKFVNLGYTYHSDINFRKAEEYFSSVPDKGSKSRGSHWQGYSTIFVYKGQPLEGALRLQERRDEHGYTIGYGWDNLCLARMYVYSGQLEECEAALNKAAEFSEVHYNTSFREDQYQFMLKTLRLMLARFKLKATHFENKNKWMSWNWWKEMPPLTLKKYKTVYQLANELALNPEREMVYYHIFHTESIISFDELWEIIKNYSNNFFEKTFRKYSQTDPRKNLQRYYEYFLGKLKMAADENEFAYDQLTAILNDPSLDREYEKLLIARIHESCAKIAGEEGWTPQKAYHLNRFYQEYPQLVPYSDLQMRFRLQLADDLHSTTDESILGTLDELSACNIDWEASEDSNYPEVRIGLKNPTHLQYQVVINQNVVNQGLVDATREGAGKRLAYRLFGIIN